MFAAPQPFATRRGPAFGALAYQTTAVEIQVAGADPHRLVALLFQGFEQSLAEALGAIAQRDTERKCRAITRALRIVDEGLRGALDLKAGGALARDLNDLYGYVVQRLSQANARNDPALLAECKRLIQPLHEAWLAIGPSPAAAGPRP
mgnify:FL=1